MLTRNKCKDYEERRDRKLETRREDGYPSGWREQGMGASEDARKVSDSTGEQSTGKAIMAEIWGHSEMEETPRF